MVTKKKTTRKTTKKTKRKVAGRSTVKRKTPGWIILLFGMLMGLVIAVVVYVKGWVPKPDLKENIPVAQETKTNIVNTVEDKSEDLSIESKKNFDFYDTLPSMEVVIDKKDITQTDTRKPRVSIIQLGAFRKLEDAEALKAQVAFIGYSTEIQSITDVNQTQWHRVRLGPYTSARKADVIKRKLESNGFNALIMKENT